MKDVLIIFFMLLFISCSHTDSKIDENAEGNDNYSVNNNLNDSSIIQADKFDDSNKSIESIEESIIPFDISLRELDNIKLNSPDSNFTGRIYTNFRQLPDSLIKEVKRNLAKSQPLYKVKISKDGWEGELSTSLDSDKLSYIETHDDIYYVLARKIIVNLRNNKSNKIYNFEINRENVRKTETEEYGMFNLFWFNINKIDSLELSFSTVIAIIDSDLGDFITVKCKKNGEVDIKNEAIVMDED